MTFAPLKCVYCGSPKISAGDFEEVDSYEASRKVTCKSCDQWWWEIYVFSLVENEVGDEILTYNTTNDDTVTRYIHRSEDENV